MFFSRKTLNDFMKTGNVASVCLRRRSDVVQRNCHQRMIIRFKFRRLETLQTAFNVRHMKKVSYISAEK